MRRKRILIRSPRLTRARNPAPVARRGPPRATRPSPHPGEPHFVGARVERREGEEVLRIPHSRSAHRARCCSRGAAIQVHRPDEQAPAVDDSDLGMQCSGRVGEPTQPGGALRERRAEFEVPDSESEHLLSVLEIGAVDDRLVGRRSELVRIVTPTPLPRACAWPPFRAAPERRRAR